MRKFSKEQLKKAGKLIGNFISLLSIIFIIYAVWKLGFDFSSIDNWYLFLAVAAVSVIVKGATVYISGYVWSSWLHFFAMRDIDMREAVCVYAKANIGKYLPGNVMHYVERNLFATNLGISQKKLAVSTVLEVISLVLAAGILAVCTSAGQLRQSLQAIFGESYLQILMLAIAGILLLAIILWLVLRKKLIPVLKEYSWKKFAGTSLLSLTGNAVVLVALGLIMVVLYAYMGGTVTWMNGSLIVSGYVIAWVLGFIIPGASGGIGVRELIITLLLGSVVGTEMVLTLSVIHRLITIVGDFLAYLVRIALRRK